MIASDILRDAVCGWLLACVAIAAGESLLRREARARHPDGALGLFVDRFLCTAPGCLGVAGVLLALWTAIIDRGFSLGFGETFAAAVLLIAAGVLARQLPTLRRAHRRLAQGASPLRQAPLAFSTALHPGAPR